MRVDPARGLLGRGRLDRGALEEMIGRSSICCSREQIGQFWIIRLWRQKVGIFDLECLHATAADRRPER